MISADTSSLIAYFAGDNSKDTNLIELALETGSLVLPPIVLAELLSDIAMPAEMKENLLQVPLIPILDGFWQRAGLLRAQLLDKKLKARLADTLISQSCIDAKVALITRDNDFRNFALHSKLVLA